MGRKILPLGAVMDESSGQLPLRRHRRKAFIRWQLEQKEAAILVRSGLVRALLLP